MPRLASVLNFQWVLLQTHHNCCIPQPEIELPFLLLSLFLVLPLFHTFVQVVSGLKYDMTIQLVMSTECRNDGQVHTIQDCKYDKMSARTFQVSVVEKKWLTPSMQLLSFKLVEQTPISSSNSNVLDSRKLSAEVSDILKTVHPKFKDFLVKFKPSYLDDAKGNHML